MSAEGVRFTIPQQEYEQERHVFDACRWINEKLTQMGREPDFHALYAERKERTVKKLIEEAMPIVALGLSFYRPPDDVFIRCLLDTPQHDGTLRVQGFNQLSLKVEVTTTETDDSTLRRQALA